MGRMLALRRRARLSALISLSACSWRRLNATVGRGLLGAAIALMACPSLTLAQSQPAGPAHWDTTVNAAKKEAKVVVFGPAGEVIRNSLVDAFKKSFPAIVLEYVGGRAAEGAARIKVEREGGVFSVDIFIGGAVTLMELGSIGALARLEPALILPEVKDPSRWRDGRHEFTNPATRYALVFSSQPNPPVVYHPKRVKVSEIDELYELLDAKWQGKVVLNDPYIAGPSGSLFRWLWRTLGADKASDFYRKLRLQAGAIDRDQRRQVEWVAQGKYAWLLGPNNAMLHQLAQRGLKFGVLAEFIDYGTHIGTGSGCLALLNRAPHGNAALVFLNWFLAKEGQQVWSKALNLQSRRLDVPVDHIPPYLIVKPGGKYWISYYEKDAMRSAQEEAVIKELFGR